VFESPRAHHFSPYKNWRFSASRKSRVPVTFDRCFQEVLLLSCCRKVPWETAVWIRWDDFEAQGSSMKRLWVFGICFGLILTAGAGICGAQVLPPLRGAYSPGFNATNSGVLPAPGFTYANYFMDYSFDQLRCPRCDAISNFNANIFADVNVFIWVSKFKILGANYAVVAGLPFTNSALSLAGLGAVGGGGGFADSFYQPFTLGWHFKRADITAAYAFFAPTGRYHEGATNNTGAGRWTNAPAAGETFYLTKNKATAFSAYEMYEFHTAQQATNIHGGQTLDLDYSLTQILPLKKDMTRLMQLGLVGYGQYQTSDNSGPGVNPTIPGHYRVNGLGGAANFILPVQKASVGVKLFKEFSNSFTVQGYSLQINAALSF
jgi:hypothetical protein